MDWKAIVEQAEAVIKAHPDASSSELAKMLQAQFRDQPIIGWLLLGRLMEKDEVEVKEEAHG